MPMWVIIIIGVVLLVVALVFAFWWASRKPSENPWQVVEARRQLKESNEEARAEVQRRGVKLHPKIAAENEKFERDETAAGRERPSIPVWRDKPNN